MTNRSGSLLAALNIQLEEQKKETLRKEAEEASIETGFQRIKGNMSTTEAVLRGAVKGTDRGPENG